MEKKNSIPWVEKYRPRTLDEVVGHPHIVRAFKTYLKTGAFPNIILSGPAGNGKTTLLYCLMNEIYGDDADENVVEFNSSMDRGINVVRGPIKDATGWTAQGDHSWLTIYLGEADGMTPDAMEALRRVIEESNEAGNVRWIADCNHYDKIPSAIKSRFAHFRVMPIPSELVLQRVDYIAHTEGVFHMIDHGVLEHIVTYVKGDMRSAINQLQALPYDEDMITLDQIQGLMPSPSMQKVAVMCQANWLPDREAMWKERETHLMELLREDNTAVEILKMMYDGFMASDNLGTMKWRYLTLIGQYTIWVQKGDPEILLRTCMEQIREVAGLA